MAFYMIQKLPFSEATFKLWGKHHDYERAENKWQQDGCLPSCAIIDLFNTYRHLVLKLHTRTAPNSTPMNAEAIIGCSGGDSISYKIYRKASIKNTDMRLKIWINPQPFQCCYGAFAGLVSISACIQFSYTYKALTIVYLCCCYK